MRTEEFRAMLKACSELSKATIYDTSQMPPAPKPSNPKKGGFMQGLSMLHQNVFPHFENKTFVPSGDIARDRFMHAPLAMHAIENINAATKKFGGMQPEYRNQLVDAFRNKLYGHYGENYGVPPEHLDAVWNRVYKPGLAEAYGTENVMNKSFDDLVSANMAILSLAKGVAMDKSRMSSRRNGRS